VDNSPTRVYTNEALDKRRAALSPEQQILLSERLRAEGAVEACTVIPQRSDNSPPPLSFLQERLWFLFEWEPQSPVYNEVTVMRLEGQIDTVAFERAYLEIARRHEILRTTYQVVDGQPVQVIHPSIGWSLPVVDLSLLSHEAREAAAQQVMKEEAHRPFNLRRDLPWRALLVRLAEEEHVIVTTQHHISCDGWSISVRQREFAALYVAFVAGKPSPLPDLPIQYADFACWQRKRLDDLGMRNLLAYWKEQLADLAPLELLTDRPRPATRTSRGATRRMVLPLTLSEALAELGQREKVTAFVICLTAFKALLARYTGQEDVAIGATVAHRDYPELEGLIGFLTETVVLRTDLSGNPTFRELLQRVHQVTQAACAHKDLPFDYLVSHVHGRRDPSRMPLIEILFDWQDWEFLAPSLHSALSGLEPRGDGGRLPTNTAKFDLTLFIAREGEDLVCDWEYNTDLYNDETIARMASCFQRLLVAALDDPGARLWDLPLLTKSEQRRLLVEWNDTHAEYAEDLCIHELLETQVEKRPHAVALVFEDCHVTYAELHRRANQLACYLRSLRVRPEILVGIYLERSIEMVVGLLGVLKAGGAYLPLDPAYPRERLAFMIKDARSPVLLTQSHLLGKLPKNVHCKHVISLDTEWEYIARVSPGAVPRLTEPDHLAYTIYTSGSTGKPKGVQVLHRAVVNFLHSMRRRPGLAEQDVLLSVTTLSFDIAVLELFLPLMVGARLELVSRAVASDGFRLMEKLSTARATILQATPATWRLLLEAGWPGGDRLRTLSGGEALPRTLADQLLKKSQSLWNLYGPTETTVWSMVHRAEEKDGPVPVGRPIDNTRVYLLDAHLQPVPVGVSGELYIGGEGLARGYLNLPALTAERFLPNPFGDKEGGLLYRTGDLACYQPDGCVKFLGRIDHQVKIHGFRIELEEIETVLGRHPAVQEAVVVAREEKAVIGPAKDKRLIAYVIPGDGQMFSVSDLRHFLQERLPVYMIPALFVTIEALPLTPSGKVNRRALPSPDGLRPDLETAFMSPRNEVERQMSGLWKKVLGLEQVGVYDDFFELGGDSLLAMRLLNCINDRFETSISLQHFFKNPTVAGTSRRVTVDGGQAEIDEILIEERLRTAFPTERAGLLENYLQERLACSLPVGVEQLAPDDDLDRFALQRPGDLWGNLEKDLGVELPVDKMATCSSIQDLVPLILAELDRALDETQIDGQRSTINLSTLEDEEVEILLGQLLSERKGK
jgi:amino acid adenylation domain-containing protein